MRAPHARPRLRTYPRPDVRVLSAGVEDVRVLSAGVDDCVRLGSQAFTGAEAFNANIGAWNTASITTLSYVCAAFRSADALGRSSMRHGGTTDARARVRTHVYALARAGVHVCMYGCTSEKMEYMYANISIYIV